MTLSEREEGAERRREWQSQFDWNEELHLWVHRQQECAGRNCCIHNPSNHPLRDAHKHFQMDRGVMIRTCEHGIGHPDPDDLEYKAAVDAEMYERLRLDVHGCDGCCWEGEK